MKRIITPVGLSIINNFFKGKNKGGGNCSGLEHLHETLKEATSASSYNDRNISSARNLLKKEIMGWAIINQNACAEFTSIKKVENEYPNEEFVVHLLPSDTVLSNFAAEIISEKEIWKNVYSRVREVIHDPYITGLQVENEVEFVQKGMKSLIARIEDLLTIVQEPKRDLLLNITGGYKATIPYLTIWGQIYNIELLYTFEESRSKDAKLIKIPKAPVAFDFTFLDDYYEIILLLENKTDTKIEDFREEIIKSKLKFREDDRTRLTESGIIESDTKDTKIKLTLVGDILLKHYKKIRSKGFRNSFSSLFGNVIELKVFKYYVEKYSNYQVQHGRVFSENGKKIIESDIFINHDKQIIVIEVKPPSRFSEISEKFEKNKFDYLASIYKDKPIILEFILYSYAEIDNYVKEQIIELTYKYQDKFQKTTWKWLDLSIGDPKNNIHWKIDNNKLKDIQFNKEAVHV